MSDRSPRMSLPSFHLKKRSQTHDASQPICQGQRDRVTRWTHLNQQEGRLVSKNARDVADADVEHRQLLDAQRRDAAEELNLVLRYQLPEGDEEAGLQAHEAMKRDTVLPGQLSIGQRRVRGKSRRRPR